MKTRRYAGIVLPLLIVAGTIPSVNAQGDYPIMEKIAQKVIAQYQGSSCEQIMAKKMQPKSSDQEQTEKKVVQQLQSDPKMRKQFLSMVAAPIANKLFECGMIP